MAAPAINLADSPRFPRTLPRAFDAEGTAKAPLPLIQDGVAQRGGARPPQRRAGRRALDRPRARRRAATRTAPTPPTSCWPAAARPDEDELCAPVERGVYVTRLWYANVVRPKETLITAVTRDGTFLIEDGRDHAAAARPAR